MGVYDKFLKVSSNVSTAAFGAVSGGSCSLFGGVLAASLIGPDKPLVALGAGIAGGLATYFTAKASEDLLEKSDGLSQTLVGASALGAAAVSISSLVMK